MKVFFIDDDESVNMYHRIIVEQYGGFDDYSFFENPIKALDALAQLSEEEYPNALFLDINMPPIDGWDFLDELKERNLRVPIVSILSTSMNPHDQIRGEEHPMVKYFQSKPLTIEFLERVKGDYQENCLRNAR